MHSTTQNVCSVFQGSGFRINFVCKMKNAVFVRNKLLGPGQMLYHSASPATCLLLPVPRECDGWSQWQIRAEARRVVLRRMFVGNKDC
jgi:hypothetical protein